MRVLEALATPARAAGFIPVPVVVPTPVREAALTLDRGVAPTRGLAAVRTLDQGAVPIRVRAVVRTRALAVAPTQVRAAALILAPEALAMLAPVVRDTTNGTAPLPTASDARGMTA